MSSLHVKHSLCTTFFVFLSESQCHIIYCGYVWKNPKNYLLQANCFLPQRTYSMTKCRAFISVCIMAIVRWSSNSGVFCVEYMISSFVQRQLCVREDFLQHNFILFFQRKFFFTFLLCCVISWPFIYKRHFPRKIAERAFDGEKIEELFFIALEL